MLLSIINDILDLSRIEDWKMELNKAPYKTVSLFQDVINQVSLKTVEKELSFIVDLDPEIPATLIGDELRVKQILINILNSAVKFTNRGEIRLSVSAAQSSNRNAVSLVLRVQDTGIGIPKARQRELFERFSRIGNERAFVTEGTGLGLSICKGLVALMHGSLSVESDEGVGSVFTARILQDVPDGKEPIASFRVLSASSVLVFETDPPNLELIGAMCARAGVASESCESTARFIECLEDKNFAWSHVIFEYKKGYSEVLKVARRHPSVKWLALLSMADFIETGRDPAIDFIFKPFLITTFARFLRGERVDFSGSLPLSNALGFAPTYFSAHGVRVLVVDDSTVNRKVVEGFLKTLDIAVEEAGSGVEAIDKAGKTKYDIIFMDHLMPDMDGMETTARIRALPGCKHVPIIALSANVSEANANVYKENGMNDCIAKPIDFNAFVVCLKKWIPAEKRMDTEARPPQTEIPPVVSEEEWIPSLDREAGIEFTGSVDNLEKILRVFEKTAPTMLDTLESARRSGNSGQFRSAVHALIGTCANIGATRLSSLARELEQAIIGGETQEVDRLYPEVHSEMGLILSGIKTHINGVKEDYS
jgi:CheY-like chemotaxis protein/HPt (histidine-containing phosphotransfer) domain-containing protein